MLRMKSRALVCLALLLLLVPILIQPGKAVKSGDNLWYEYWGDHQEYGHETPENVSSTTTVYDSTYKHWAKVALVVSVYEYAQYGPELDFVYLTVTLYWDSFAEEGFQPIPANYVNLYLDKDADGSNLNDQSIDIEKSATPDGFHQGWLLDQNIWTDSTEDDRKYWGLNALSFAVGFFNEPIGIAMDLILLAAAWLPSGGVDYQDADWGDLYATSHWHRDQGYDISSQNPLRQYCFNTYRWFLKPHVNPSTYFGLKISAQVTPADPRFGYYVDLPPVYLRIHRSHKLSISTTSGGNTEPAPGTHVFGVGESVTVTASAYSGYYFNYWILDGEQYGGDSTNPITVTMDSDHTLKAYFQISGGGVGGGCPFVYVWNGSRYVVDNNLLPAAEDSDRVDVMDYYRLQQPLALDKGKYSLLISEPDKHTYLDQVQLLAVDHQSNVNVAVSSYGEILTYRNPTPPVIVTNSSSQDVTDLIDAPDDNYFEGHADDYLILDFGSLNLTDDAKLVLRTDLDPCQRCKRSILVQVLNSTGSWTTVATFIPRIYWSTDIVDLSAHLPDVNGDVKVRLYFTANHLIDFAGLDTSEQEHIEGHYATLFSAVHSQQGDVKNRLTDSDNAYGELLPEEQIELEFKLPQKTKTIRDFILIIEGYWKGAQPSK